MGGCSEEGIVEEEGAVAASLILSFCSLTG